MSRKFRSRYSLQSVEYESHLKGCNEGEGKRERDGERDEEANKYSGAS